MKSTVTVIRKKREYALPPVLRQVLPSEVQQAMWAVSEQLPQEIHLRVGRACTVTVSCGENVVLPLQWTREDMDTLIRLMCNGSGYAWRNCIDRGYLPLAGGVRVGVCGSASEREDTGQTARISVQRIDSVCIRLPGRFPCVGWGVLSLVQAQFPRGTLFYAPPGVGKTTLLRSLAMHLSTGQHPLRTVVVDSRRELDDGSFDSCATLDILAGYPKKEGIEIATRTLDAQVIVCDELGSGEARAVLSAVLCGVPLLASAHAATLPQLLSRPEIRLLHGAGAFGAYVGLARGGEKEDYIYAITKQDEVRGCSC